jgi:hypothetical protein
MASTENHKNNLFLLPFGKLPSAPLRNSRHGVTQVNFNFLIRVYSLPEVLVAIYFDIDIETNQMLS